VIEGELADLARREGVSLNLERAAALLEDLQAHWDGEEEAGRAQLAHGLFAALWVDLDARRVVGVQLIEDLHPVRALLEQKDALPSNSLGGRHSDRSGRFCLSAEPTGVESAVAICHGRRTDDGSQRRRQVCDRRGDSSRCKRGAQPLMVRMVRPPSPPERVCRVLHGT